MNVWNTILMKALLLARDIDDRKDLTNEVGYNLTKTNKQIQNKRCMYLLFIFVFILFFG